MLVYVSRTVNSNKLQKLLTNTKLKVEALQHAFANRERGAYPKYCATEDQGLMSEKKERLQLYTLNSPCCISLTAKLGSSDRSVGCSNRMRYNLMTIRVNVKAKKAVQEDQAAMNSRSKIRTILTTN